jgi:hypothetical protein
MTDHKPMRKKPTNRYAGKRGKLPNMATPRRPEPPKSPGWLGIVLLVGIAAALVWGVMVIFKIGPYRLAPTPTPTVSPTPSITYTFSPSSTWTSTVTATDLPTATLTITPSATITATATLAPLPFIVRGEPEYVSNELVRPALDCTWLIIAGQVWDLQDTPITGLTLHLYGDLGETPIDRTFLTGQAPGYGESGYEFTLEGLLMDSEDTLWIQLVDTNGLAFSHPYPLETFDDCQKNLILVNFKQVR